MAEENKIIEEKKENPAKKKAPPPAEGPDKESKKAKGGEVKAEGVDKGGAEEAPAAKKVKKKVKRGVAFADIHIQSTFNNTIITVSDPTGNTICWSTAGARGFKGSKRSTPFAAQLAAEDVANKARELGVRSANVYVKGPGAGRESALRAIQHTGIKVIMIRDVTPIPHNGCRPPKRRRI